MPLSSPLPTLSHAISNNVALYQAVLGAHGIAWCREEALATTDVATPPYYGNLVTILPAVQPAMTRVAELAASPPRPDWGMKDSYACLDAHALASYGMRLLFEACWYAAPAGVTGGEAEAGYTFRAVDTPSELALWEAAWQRSSPAPGVRVFPDEVLDPGRGLRFLGAYDGPHLVGGVLANRSHEAIGVSNVFATHGTLTPALVRDAVRAVARLAPERHLVGYGPDAEARVLTTLGVKPLGPLRVYVAGRS